MFKNLKLGIKIGGGYAIMALILISVVLATITQVNRVKEVNNRIMNLRAPTARSSLMMLNGINHSLAALRGWMILGSDQFKVEREQAWSTEIEPSLKNLREFAANWTNHENVERLKIIESVIIEFKNAQQEIEDIAQKKENVPAINMLLTEAAPQAKILATQITRMIDLEKEQPGTPERKNLLGIMADVRGTTGLGLAAIRAYLLSGESRFIDQFDTLWDKNSKRFKDLQQATDLLTSKQQKAFDSFKQAREIFVVLPPKMFASKQGVDWNRANYWLGTRAAPKGDKLVETLKAMTDDQKKLMLKDEATVLKMNASLNRIMWILLFVGVVACLILGIVITRAITGPIQKAVQMIQTVAAAAEEMSVNMDSVAAATEETSVNVNMVASAAEEMSATISEISSNTEKTSTITNTAVTQSQKASAQIHELGGAALEIGKVTESINDISEQTNLLALNATIEAARAGEAGKGFAVVANEIKELAKQTSEATDEIKEKLEKIQNASKDAIADITEITGVIGEVSEMVSIVAVTVEEQASATQEIADNVSQASLGIQEVNENVTQASTVTGEVASDIAEVEQAAQKLNRNSKAVSGNVHSLKELSGKLSTIVSQFKV